MARSLTLFLFAMLAAPAAAQGPLPDGDVRQAPDGPAMPSGATARAAAAASPRIVVTPDSLRGGTRVVRRLDGFLTAPSDADAAEITLDFVRANLALFNLRRSDLATLVQVRRWRSVDGVTHLIWAQRAGGVELFDNGLRSHVTRDGRLISVGGSPLSGSRRAADRASFPAGKAPAGKAQRTWLSDGGTLIPAWRVTRNGYDLLLDARTGRVLRRHNLVRGVARASVFENFPAAPFGGAAREVDISPWLSADDRLRGETVHVFADMNGDEEPGPNEQIPPSGGGDWLYPFQAFTFNSPCARLICAWNSKQRRSWRKNLYGEAANAFYYTNSFHDRLEQLGFTDDVGNYGGDDRIEVSTAVGANTFNGLPGERNLNNASMRMTPDGEPGLMKLLLNANRGFDTMNGYDAATIYHELTHGLVGRLIVDKDGYTATLGQGDAMGEGFGDWFAYSVLNGNGSVPDGPDPGEVRMFVAETKNRKGIRNQPLDCPVGAPGSVCPAAGKSGPGGFTYADYGRIFDGPESHADGEIWAQTLWDLRSSFIAAHGPAGIERVERLVVSALQLSVDFPSFLDMRNALLEADLVNGGADRDRIWQVFAARGMGLFAGTLQDEDEVFPDFVVPPPVDVPTGTFTGTVRDFLTGKRLSRADVFVPGIGLVDRTDSRGRFEIPGMPHGTVPVAFAFKPGYHFDHIEEIKITSGEETSHKFEMIHNWSARATGTRVVSPRGGRRKCGPGGAIDEEPNPWTTKVNRPRSLVLKLRRPVDILLFGVTPGVDCPAHFLDASSSARAMLIEVAGKDRHFRKVARPRFKASQNDYTNVVDPGPVVLRRTHFIRLTVLRPQGPRGHEFGYSYETDMGMGELEVFGTPSAARSSASRR